MEVERQNETPVVPVSVDKLAMFREQVTAEQAEKSQHSKMSEAAKAKLRALNEHERLNAEADTRLVKEFNSRTWTVEQLVDLFAKYFGGPSPRRRAIKAFLCLNRGARVYHIHDVSLLGELLPDETEMPMSRFLSRYQLPENETVTPAVATDRPSRPARLCKSGAKCIWAKYRKAAPAVGRSPYCTPACQKCDTARRRRGLGVTSTGQSARSLPLEAA